MPIYISRGRFTSDAVKGMVANPENREEAVSKLFESVGGKLIGWRLIPHRMESCGYLPVHNGGAKDGLWKINDKWQAIYGNSDLSLADQLKAARGLTNQE